MFDTIVTLWSFLVFLFFYLQTKKIHAHSKHVKLVELIAVLYGIMGILIADSLIYTIYCVLFG